MSRNPMAGSLKHFRQRVVPDKRKKAFHRDTQRAIDDAVAQAVGRAFVRRD